MTGDEDDDLLRRLAALRAPADDPDLSVKDISHQATIDEQARNAAVEDDELEAIADGRSLPDVSVLLPLGGAAGDADLRRRFVQLKGQEDEEQDDGDMRDDEVCLISGKFFATIDRHPD